MRCAYCTDGTARGRSGLCRPCYRMAHGAGRCTWCGPADTPRAVTMGHHRLFLVVGGSTWRFWWALDAQACRVQIAAAFPGVNVAFAVRRARAADLVTVTEYGRAINRG